MRTEAAGRDVGIRLPVRRGRAGGGCDGGEGIVGGLLRHHHQLAVQVAALVQQERGHVHGAPHTAALQQFHAVGIHDPFVGPCHRDRVRLDIGQHPSLGANNHIPQGFDRAALDDAIDADGAIAFQVAGEGGAGANRDFDAIGFGTTFAS